MCKKILIFGIIFFLIFLIFSPCTLSNEFIENEKIVSSSFRSKFAASPIITLSYEKLEEEVIPNNTSIQIPLKISYEIFGQYANWQLRRLRNEVVHIELSITEKSKWTGTRENHYRGCCLSTCYKSRYRIWISTRNGNRTTRIYYKVIESGKQLIKKYLPSKSAGIVPLYEVKSIFVISKLLGHSDPNITMKHYGHLIFSLHEELGNQIDGGLTPVPVQMGENIKTERYRWELFLPNYALELLQKCSISVSKTQKPAILGAFYRVGRVGVEPTRYCYRRILSLAYSHL